MIIDPCVQSSWARPGYGHAAMIIGPSPKLLEILNYQLSASMGQNLISCPLLFDLFIKRAEQGGPK